MEKAQEKVVDSPKVKKSKGFYFTNRRYSGLTVVINNDPDIDKRVTVSFTPRTEKWQGDDVRVGYFTTTDPKVADLVRVTHYTKEITEKEFIGN